MTLREWLRASAEPGPVGRLHFGLRHRVRPPRNEVVWRGCGGLALLGAWILFMSGQSLDLGAYAYAALLTVMYLAVGLLVHPAPEESNVGLGRRHVRQSVSVFRRIQSVPVHVQTGPVARTIRR